MTNAITGIRDLWTIHAPATGGIGKIEHTIYEKTTYPGGSSVLQVKHYDVTLYDSRARTVQSTSKGQNVDLKV